MKNFKIKIGMLLLAVALVIAPHRAMAQIPTLNIAANVQKGMKNSNLVKEAASTVQGMQSNGNILAKFKAKGGTMAAGLLKKAKKIKETAKGALETAKNKRDDVQNVKNRVDDKAADAKSNISNNVNFPTSDKQYIAPAPQQQQPTARPFQEASDRETTDENMQIFVAPEQAVIEEEEEEEETAEGMLVNGEFVLPQILIDFCKDNTTGFNQYKPDKVRECLGKLIYDLKESSGVVGEGEEAYVRGMAAIDETKQIYSALKQQLLLYQYMFSMKHVQDAADFPVKIVAELSENVSNEQTVEGHVANISVLNMTIAKLINDLDKVNLSRHLTEITTRFENAEIKDGNFAPPAGIKGNFVIPIEMVDYCSENFVDVVNNLENDEGGQKLAAALTDPENIKTCLTKLTCRMNDDVSLVNEEAKEAFQLMNQQTWIYQFASVLKNYQHALEIDKALSPLEELLENPSEQMLGHIQNASISAMNIGKFLNDANKNAIARQVMVFTEYFGSPDRDSVNMMCKRQRQIPVENTDDV